MLIKEHGMSIKGHRMSLKLQVMDVDSKHLQNRYVQTESHALILQSTVTMEGS